MKGRALSALDVPRAMRIACATVSVDESGGTKPDMRVRMPSALWVAGIDLVDGWVGTTLDPRLTGCREVSRELAASNSALISDAQMLLCS